ARTEGPIGEVRRHVDDGGRELLRKIAGRESRTLRSARRAHDGHALSAGTLRQPLCTRAKGFERDFTEGRWQILVVENALGKSRMAVACEQGGLSLGQSAPGTGQNNDGHTRDELGCRRE